MNENKLYTPKETSEILDLDRDLIRKYCEYFNVITSWTQPDKNKGHRRFTKENIEQLLEIKKLIQDEKLSWEQTRDFLNGTGETFVAKESKSQIDEKLDKMIELQKQNDDFNENQKQFNEELLKQLQSRDEAIQQLNQKVDNQQHMIQQLSDQVGDQQQLMASERQGFGTKIVRDFKRLIGK